MKLEIKNLHFTYPGTDKEVLKDVNITIEGNTPTAIVGQNGAGKTTLVKHFNNILSPTSGEIFINSESTVSKSTAKWSKDVGYVFQNPDDQLFLSTVKEELEFGPNQIGVSEQHIAELLPIIAALCGLQDKLETHPFDLNGTEKKFCTIASVMMMEPKLIVFDEPTTGQDISGNHRLSDIVKYLQEKDTLCITISHDMKFVVNNFQRVIVLLNGSVLIDGTKEEVFSQPDIIKESFVAPPPITRVGNALNLSKTFFAAEDLVNELIKNKSK